MSRTRREFIARETAPAKSLRHYLSRLKLVGKHRKRRCCTVPIGFAGPMLVNGEHAKGEFYVPIATEGTLTASYSRGMR